MMAPRAAEIGLECVDHVDIRVRNLERARRFFVDQMGMDVIGEGEDHLFLLIGDQVLGLRRLAGGRQGPTGVDHIALRVGEWVGLRNRVRRARLEVTGEKERDDSRSLFLKGPEGLRIELVWRPNPHNHPACPSPEAPAPSVAAASAPTGASAHR
jgi:catechol 2,3-dioxygenase-like lactoylglutathione lyase family enzyme